MYVAEFDGPDGVWIQGAVRMQIPASAATGSQDWSQGCERRMRVVRDLNLIGLSLRIALGGDGKIRRELSVLANAGEGPVIRGYLGGFALLEGIVDETVSLPLTRTDFDDWSMDFPALQCLASPALQQTQSGPWLTSGFHIANYLTALMEGAAELGHAFVYQVNISPYRPAATALRDAQRNGLDLREIRGIPQEVIDHQDAVIDQFRNASLIVQEAIGVDTLEAASWADRALARRFDAAFGHLGFQAPGWNFSADDGAGDFFAVSAHPAALTDIVEIPVEAQCEEAVGNAFIDELLIWRPPAGLPKTPPGQPPQPTAFWGGAAPPGRPGGGGLIHAPVGAAATLPAVYEGPEPYIFISYKHQDATLVAPMLQHLDEGGRHIWLDRGIRGGEEWDTVLEERIQGCVLLMAFISQGAIDSKYCRREIKFADALDKPMLFVALEPVRLAQGMQMLLQQYQMIFTSADNCQQKIDEAIRNVA